MSTITTLIFSKNRACQLDLLIRSILQNFIHISNDIVVLYDATTYDYKEGYNKLFDTYSHIKNIEENNFKNDVLSILYASKHICFFVDDDIVYRKPKMDNMLISKLLEEDQYGSFSFRLGVNTYIQDPYTQKHIKYWPSMILFKLDYTESFISWNYKDLPLNNFSYPFSVDGHVYNSDDIIPHLDYDFDTPNSFEGKYPQQTIPPQLFSFRQSCVVNNPINLVGSSNNKAGILYGHTLEEMNKEYLNGRQIKLAPLCQNKIVGCHQEMEIEYESA